jgi:hypothetical protein
VAEPRHADTIAEGRPLDADADAIDDADDLVAGNDRQPRHAKLAVDDVQVGATDRARLDAKANLAGTGNGIEALLELERSARLA